MPFIKNAYFEPLGSPHVDYVHFYSQQRFVPNRKPPEGLRTYFTCRIEKKTLSTCKRHRIIEYSNFICTEDNESPVKKCPAWSRGDLGD